MATVVEPKNKPGSNRRELRIAEELQLAIKRIRVNDMFVGGLILALITLAFATASIMLDRWLDLPLWLRQLNLFAFLAVLAGAAYVLIIRPIRAAISPRYAAWKIERTIPDGKNSIINWVDLSEQQLPDAVKTAVGSQASQEINSGDVNQATESRYIPWLATVCGLFVLILAVQVIVSKPAQFFSLMSRTFTPVSHKAIASQTIIKLVAPANGNVELNVGEPLELQVSIGGRVPDADSAEKVRLQFWYVEGSESWEEIPFAPGNSRRDYTLTVPDYILQNGLWYRVAAGDDQTDAYQVKVISRPAIREFQALYTYPEYLRAKPAVGKEPKIEGYRGTEVVLKTKTNRRVRTGRMVIEGVEQPIVGTVDAEDRNSLKFAFTLDQNSTYRITFNAETGEASQPTPAYPIRVFVDQAPVVQITKPDAESGDIPLNGLLEIDGLASDDFGLDKLTLKLRGYDGDNSFVVADRPFEGGRSFRRESDDTYPTRLEYQDSFRLDELTGSEGQPIDWQVGQEIEFWLEAVDNCTVPKPNVGRSQKVRLTIGEPFKSKEEVEAVEEAREKRKTEEQSKRQDQNQKLDQEKREAPEFRPDEGENEGDPEEKSEPGEGGEGDPSGEPAEGGREGDAGKQGTEGTPKEPGDSKEPTGEPSSEGMPGDQPQTGSPAQETDPNQEPKEKKEPGSEGDPNGEPMPGSKGGTPDTKEGSPQDKTGSQPEPKDEKVKSEAERIEEALREEQEERAPGTAKENPEDSSAERDPQSPDSPEQAGGTSAERKPSPEGQPGQEPSEREADSKSDGQEQGSEAGEPGQARPQPGQPGQEPKDPDDPGQGQPGGMPEPGQEKPSDDDRELEPGELSRETGRDGKAMPPPKDDVERLMRQRDNLTSQDQQQRQEAEEEFDDLLGKKQREELQKNLEKSKQEPDSPEGQEAQEKVDELSKKAKDQQQQNQPGQDELDKARQKAQDLASDDDAKRQAAEEEFDDLLGKDRRERLQDAMKQAKQDQQSGDPMGDSDKQSAQQKQDDLINQAARNEKSKAQQEQARKEAEELAQKAQDLNSEDDAKREAAEKELDEKIGKENREKAQQLAKDLQSDDADTREKAQKEIEEMANKAQQQAQDRQKQEQARKEAEELAQKAQDLNSEDDAKREAAEKELDEKIGKENREKAQQLAKDLQSDDADTREKAQKEIEEMANKAQQQAQDRQKQEQARKEAEELAQKAQDLNSEDDAKREAAEKELDEKIGKENREKAQQLAKDLQSDDADTREKAQKEIEEMAKKAAEMAKDNQDYQPNIGGEPPTGPEGTPLEDDPRNRLKTAQLQLERFEKNKYNKALQEKLGYTQEEFEKFIESYRDMVTRLRDDVDKPTTAQDKPDQETGPAALQVGGSERIEAGTQTDRQVGGRGASSAPPGFSDAQRRFAEEAARIRKSSQPDAP